MKQTCYLLGMILLGLLSCSQQLQLPKDNSSNQNVFLPFRIDTVVFIDKRIDTLTWDMKLPLLTSKRREWTAKPGISEATKAEIASMISKASYAERYPTIVTVTVLDAYYKITGDATKVGEHTLFDCELSFTLSDSQATFKSHSKMNYDFEGVFNATEEHAKEIYNITIRNTVFDALKRAERSLDE